MGGLETLDPPSPEAAMSEGRDLIREHVIDVIRGLHEQSGGLSRIHRSHPALYAQARRAFGSWREAVAAAGINYDHELNQSLRRGLVLRDQRRALWHALSRFLTDHTGVSDAMLAERRPELASRVRRCWGSVDEAVAWAARNRTRGRSQNGPPEAANGAA